MEGYTYINLKTSISCIQEIYDFQITQEVNEHAYMKLRGLVGEEYGDGYVKELCEQKVIRVYLETEEQKTLFYGLLQSAEIKHVNRVYYMEVTAVSFSYLLDIKKRKRSFQDKSMLYRDLVRSIVKEYQSGAVLDTASEGSAVGQLLVQYHETDWEFLKRLASHFHKSVYSDVTFSAPKIFWGLRVGINIGELNHFNFTVKKNLKDFYVKRDNYLPDYKENDAIRFYIKTEQLYEVGDYCTYQGKKLYIRSKVTKIENEILYFHYELCEKGSLEEPEMLNGQIAGISLEGTVLERVKDHIKVHLSIDAKQDKAKAWLFPYSTQYTAEGCAGWYCMPEEGDTVNIYFPEQREALGVGINCIRKNSSGCNKVNVPENKYFRTADGKEIMFTPDEIKITCCGDGGKKKEPIYIRLKEKSGIDIISSEPISFYTDKSIRMQAEDSIRINANKDINITCKSSEISMTSKVEIKGEDVKIN